MNEETLFAEALEKQGEARASFLEEHCRGDVELRKRLEALIQAHDNPDPFLDAPAPVAGATVDNPMQERPGGVIGPYKLIEQIGEGGMGTVWMAQQTEPVKRLVAIKFIKAGMDTKQVIGRFEVERQSLALMDHPNIARVLDVGTTSAGRPYFVMELVQGVPITKYCDDKCLTPRQRLELFVPVCQAIRHAHQKGIIHRDIKPSNVLVAPYDGKPVPKVIDFGVAKAMEQKLTEQTFLTHHGTLVGTLEYMSPEQAEMSALGVDTRSDIYSLGVLLYELLTGSTPLSQERVKKSGYAEILRLIREEEPQRPSTRLSDSGEALASISARRHMEPARLTKLVRGELDWIVMKCLDKDRARRYEMASSLAADVQRYLNDEAVQACPPSTWYRFHKFARRNKRALATVSVVAVAMVLAVVALATSTVLIARALQAEIQAKEDLRRDSYFHRIALAHHKLSVNNLKHALQLLEECPEDLRDWEWYYLMRLCRVEPVVLRDTIEVNSLAFSPSGKFLATAGGDGAIKVWNVETGKVIQILAKAHGGFACSVAFHPDGKHLASVGQDKQVRVWDWKNKQEVFHAPSGGVHALLTAHAAAFSPDGRHLAVGSGGDVVVWDWRNKQVLHTFAGLGKYRVSVAFSRDGRRLATGNWAGSVNLLDARAGGEPLCTFPETRYPVGGMAFDKDGGRLATASFNRRVDVWDTTTGELAYFLPHRDGLVLGIAFSPDGKRLASTGEDRIVHIWDPATRREVLSLRGHTGGCGCLAFSPDGRRLASASQDKTIRIWDATPLQGHEGQETQTMHYGNEIWSLAVSPDGQKIASAVWSMPVVIRNAQTGLDRVEFPGHSAVVFCVAWHPKGQRIAIAGGDGPVFSVKVWNTQDTQSKREIFTIPETPGGTEYTAVAYSPDGQYLVTGNKDGKVQVWDADNGKAVGTLGTHDREIRGVVFSHKGLYLASTSGDGKVKLWVWDPTRPGQVQKPKFERQVWVPGAHSNVAFSPDGQCLVTGSEEHTVKIWEVPTGRELETLRGHTGDVCAVAFSPDGRWLATAGEDSTIRIWDTKSWKHQHTLRGHTGLVSSLAFLPKSERLVLVSGSRDHTVKVWDVTQWAKTSDP